MLIVQYVEMNRGYNNESIVLNHVFLEIVTKSARTLLLTGCLVETLLGEL